MHGARGGAPEGKANGNYKTGEHTAEVRENRVYKDMIFGAP